MKIKEAAVQLSIKPGTLAKMCRQGTLPSNVVAKKVKNTSATYEGHRRDGSKIRKKHLRWELKIN